MKGIKYSFTFLILFTLSLILQAQSIKRCSFDQIYNESMLDSSFIETQNNFNHFLKTYQFEKSDTVIRIPIVIHVVYENASENISNEQIESQLRVLNEDFRKLNSDTTNATGFSTADTKIEFCLAKETPLGQHTSGVTRTKTDIFEIGKTNSYYNVAPIWDRNRYINVWVCNADPDSNAIGFAFSPSISNASNEGIVVDVTAFGTIGTALAPYDKGRTLTHEMGHMLNLLHIWGNRTTCGSSDFVSDTPEQEREVVGCPNSHTSCGSRDMLSNYMGYIDDACMGNFTQGQKVRMRAAIQSFRPGWATDNECWTVGLKENDLIRESRLLPNPNDGSFELQLSPNLNRNNIELYIYNMLGKLVDFSSIEDVNGFQIELKNQPTGFYFLRIQGESGSEVKKFIVSKD